MGGGAVYSGRGVGEGGKPTDLAGAETKKAVITKATLDHQHVLTLTLRVRHLERQQRQ